MNKNVSISKVGKVGKFLKDWSELLIVLPIVLIIFLCNGFLLHHIDPTAAIVDAGVLSIINTNLIVFLMVCGSAYFIYRLYFWDFFKECWWTKLTPWQATLVHVILFKGILLVSYLCLTRNM